MDEPLTSFRWESTDVRFGPGALGRLGPLLEEAGARRVLVLAGRGALRAQGILPRALAALPPGRAQVLEGLAPNPGAAECQRVAEAVAKHGADAVVALGGGSVLDCAKVANVAAGAGTTVESLLRGEARAAPPQAPVLVAVPTTAGTGSEVTPFATVWDFQALRKRSLDTPAARPTHALVDPRLTLGLPPDLTRATAADALSHGLESLWSRRAVPPSRALAFEAVRILVAGLPRVLRDPRDEAARGDVAWGSLLGGMAISLTRTAAAHALSYGFTLRFGVPHGLAVATLLPGVLRANLAALPRGTVARLAADLGAADYGDLPGALEHFLSTHGLLADLRARGVRREDLPALAAAGDHPGRMDNNVRALGAAEAEGILRLALDRPTAAQHRPAGG